jgi:hypothetical protein
MSSNIFKQPNSIQEEIKEEIAVSADSFVIQFAIQKYKDMVHKTISLRYLWL